MNSAFCFLVGSISSIGVLLRRTFYVWNYRLDQPGKIKFRCAGGIDPAFDV